MVRSLGIKFAMLGVTLGLIWWMGWPVKGSLSETSNIERSQSVLPKTSVLENAQPMVGGQVNLNFGTIQELEALPGIGPVLAQRIVAYRVQHGKFASVQELKKVHGIGEARLTRLLPLITIHQL